MNFRGGSVALLLIGVVALAAPRMPEAQTLTVLYTFTGEADGGVPSGGLVRDEAGNLYGATTYGGVTNCSLGCGVIFKIDSNGKETVLYQFSGGKGGAHPLGPMLRGKDGYLYGATSEGGLLACNSGTGCGVVFRLSRAGKVVVLHRFAGGSDGESPNGSLLRDADGNLYGSTTLGGRNGRGTVFKLSPTHKVTILHSFPAYATDGMYPNGLLRDALGNLYGTTSFSNDSTLGKLFKVNPAGKENILFSFGGTAGEFPFSTLIQDTAGNLYGTAQFGGDLTCNAPSSGCGTVFKFSTKRKETVLYSFAGVPDGDAPQAPPVRDGIGNLYGVTRYGGTGSCPVQPQSGCGTVFRLDKGNNETLLHSFTGGADGWNPFAGLVMDSVGHLYGETSYGGASGCGNVGCGVVFRITLQVGQP